MPSSPKISRKTVTVFGSSRPSEGESDYEDARSVGRALADAGFSVCSGGYGGVMAAVSRGAKERGAQTFGVTADFFTASKANEWIDVEKASNLKGINIAMGVLLSLAGVL